MSKLEFDAPGSFALGIHMGHDAAASLCSPTEMLCSISEERLSRVKHHSGFPQLAIEKVLKTAGVSADQVCALALTADVLFFPEHRNFTFVSVSGDAQSSAELGSADRTVSIFRPSSVFCFPFFKPSISDASPTELASVVQQSHKIDTEC